MVVLGDAGAGEDNNCSKTGAKARTLQERRLLNCLLHVEYDPAVRPATDPGAPVDVIVDSIDATVIDLVCFSDISSLFSLAAWHAAHRCGLLRQMPHVGLCSA